MQPTARLGLFLSKADTDYNFSSEAGSEKTFWEVGLDNGSLVPGTNPKDLFWQNKTIGLHILYVCVSLLITIFHKNLHIILSFN